MNGSTNDGAPTDHVVFATAENWVARTAVIAVAGDLDMITAPDLADAIRAAAAQGPTALIVDLSKVGFLGSAGMSALVGAHQEISGSARFGVVADGPATSRPLRLLGLDTLLTLYQTLDAALVDVADA
ncbi:MAG: STAS domain-containing protein [Mycobacterium sp.]